MTAGRAQGNRGGDSMLIAPDEADTRTAYSSDDVAIATQCWGDPSKPAMVFIHGFNQAHLCWVRQVRSALCSSFYLVTYDLRGHGASGKPAEEHRYRDAHLWCDDLSAVMDAAGIEKAVLVGWSLGARVAFDYLYHVGSARVAGLNVVGNGVTTRPELRNSGGVDLFSLLRSDDLSQNIAGTLKFLRRCFERQPDPADFATMLAYNMVVPPAVRRMMMGMPCPPEAFFRTLRVPVLLSFGEADRLNSLEAAKIASRIIPDARLSLYAGVGHAPFYEAAERFNAELEAFARGIDAARATASQSPS
jgi:pimeloyl-ACP methyl ester carboxylesterase